MAVPGQLTFARRLGPAARLAIWLTIGVACVVLDVRYQAMEGLRSGLSMLLHPVREALRAPADVATEIADFFTRHRLLLHQRDALLAERARLALTANTALDLKRENEELRALLALQTRPEQQLVRAALLYQGHDWFSQKIVLDRGAAAGLRSGLPVIDAGGLMGQISQVYPGSSEVTLVTSPGQLTPVMIERTGQRGLVAGLGHGQLELRYMPSQTDVRVGDRLVTSGIDRVYPAALPVARVTRVSRPQAGPYLRIEGLPLAEIERSRAVLVLVARPKAAQP
ncbi:MAG: rod shape-determining protein MreC [Thiobacillus sp.]|nr:rod shape-determining protein MreC [Thiobacillus sp.]